MQHHEHKEMDLKDLNQSIINRLRANNEAIVTQIRELSTIFTDNQEMIGAVEQALNAYETQIKDSSIRLDNTVGEVSRLEGLLDEQTTRHDEETKLLRDEIERLVAKVKNLEQSRGVVHSVSVDDVVELEPVLTDEEKIKFAEQYDNSNEPETVVADHSEVM